MSNTLPDGPSVGAQSADDVLQQHFDRAPIGMLLLAGDRTIVRANETISTLTGLTPAVLGGSPFRRFLSSEAPLDLEDRIFEELERSGRWLGEIDIRTSIGDTSPMLVAITPVAREHDPVRYVVSVLELGNQRWIEAESSRRAAELGVLSALAIATGSTTEPEAMFSACARTIVEGLELDACWIHRFERSDSALMLAAVASNLNPSIRLSPYMIPNAVNPGVLHAVETREQVTESGLLERSIATVLHVPLMAREDVVGVMSLLSVEGEKLSTRNSELLRAVGYKLGTAIQNVRLLESVSSHQVELQEKNVQLEGLVTELREADRMKNEFLANTSHELRTPLNSIIGFLNLVLDGLVESDAERNELLTHALTSGKHLLSLINDVLDLARMEAGRLQVEVGEVDLGTILDQVALTIAVQAREKGLGLFCPRVPDGLRVTADEARLRQCLVNVLGNAIKFTPKGSVTVGVETPADSRYVEIWVRDTGIGIDDEKRARLFRKFSQGDTSTTRKFGGSGLGLVIVKELLEMMGGSVRLESPGTGHGSTITMTLPRAGAGAPAGGGASGPAAPATDA
jgi:PAS domain S-box-containing protein